MDEAGIEELYARLSRNHTELRPRLVRDQGRVREILGRAIIPIYTTKSMHRIVGPPDRVYYRVYERGDEYAVLFLYEWGVQYIPPHKYDYEPVVVILDKHGLRIKEVYVDGYHYLVDRNDAPLGFGGKPFILIDNPWRAMEVKWGDPDRSLVMVYPLDERTGKLGPKPVFLSKRILEDLTSRPENPLKLHPRILGDPFSVRYAKHWATFEEPDIQDYLDDITTNYGLKTVTSSLLDAFRSLLERIRDFLYRFIGSHGKKRLRSLNE